MEEARTRSVERAAARIFVVEDHALVREQLVAFIEREADLHVCGTARTAAAARRQLATEPPDLLVLGLSLKSSHDFGPLMELSRLCPGLPVLVLSMFNHASYVEKLLAAGASVCMTKQEAVTRLLAGIRVLLAGRALRPEKRGYPEADRSLPGPG